MIVDSKMSQGINLVRRPVGAGRTLLGGFGSQWVCILEVSSSIESLSIIRVMRHFPQEHCLFPGCGVLF